MEMTDSDTDACRGFGIRPLHTLKKSTTKSNAAKPSSAAVEKQIVVMVDRNRNKSGAKKNINPKGVLTVAERSVVTSPSSSSSNVVSSTTVTPPRFNFVHPLNGNLLDRRRNIATVDDIESYLFECSTCNLKRDISSIFLHAKEVHGVFICLYCLQFYKFAKELMVHLHREHRVPSQRYATGTELLQQGGNNSLLLCVECNKTFLSEDVETVKTHAHECRISTGICPKCGTILLLSLLGGHIASCRGSMNLNLEGNSTISTSQLRSRDNSCKFCSKKFSPSKIAAHMRACSARNLGSFSKPTENGSHSETIGFKPKHQVISSQKRPIPPLPQLLRGERGTIIPLVVSKKNKIMPELNPVTTSTASINSHPQMNSSSTNSVVSHLKVGSSNAGIIHSSSAQEFNREVGKLSSHLLSVKSQRPQPKVVIGKQRPGRRRPELSFHFSKPPESTERKPAELPSLTNLPSSITLTPVMAKFMNGDLPEDKTSSSVVDEDPNVSKPNPEEDVKMEVTESPAPFTEQEDQGGIGDIFTPTADDSRRPRRCLKKVTREDFMYDTVSKRSYQRSHSISTSSMSATVTPSGGQLGNNSKRSIKVLTGGRQRHSMSVSEIVMDNTPRRLSNQANPRANMNDNRDGSNVFMFDYDHVDAASIDNGKFPSKSLVDFVHQRGQLNSNNKRKSDVMSPNVYSPSMSVVPIENFNYDDESSESDPEPEVKLDPLLVEQDQFRRLGLLIGELCDKLTLIPTAYSDEEQTVDRHELLVNYNLNDKSDDSILTDMLNKTSDTCVYCRQVKIIRVDKRQLVMHLLSMHSWDLRCLRTPAMLVKSLKATGEIIASQKTSPALDEKIKEESNETKEERADITELIQNDQLKNKDERLLPMEDTISANEVNSADTITSDSSEKTDDISLPPNELGKLPEDNSEQLTTPIPVKPTSTATTSDTAILNDDALDTTTISNSKIPETENCDSQKLENPGTSDKETNVNNTLHEVKHSPSKIEGGNDDSKEINSCLTEGKGEPEVKDTFVNDTQAQLKENNSTIQDIQPDVNLPKTDPCDEMEVVQIEWKEFKLTLLEKVFRSENIVFAYKDPSLEPFGEIPCECLLCGFRADSQKNLFPHWRKVHRGVAMKCAMCHGKFLFAGALFSHLCFGTPSPVITVSNNSSVAVFSPTAGTSIVNGPTSGMGIVGVSGGDQSGVENDDGSSDTIVLRYQCSICENFQLPGFFNYMVHLRKDHNKCELCLETMKTQKDLEHHMKKHKLNHFCWKCGVTYCAKPNFMTHLFWKHGTESEDCSKCLKKKWPHIYHFCVPPTTFVCDVCSLYFTKPKSLLVHKRLHTGEKLKRCLRKDCVDKFVSKKLLQKHIENAHINPPKVIEPVPEPTPIQEDPVASNPETLSNETESVDPKPEDTGAVDTKDENEADSLIDTKTELSSNDVEKPEAEQSANDENATPPVEINENTPKEDSGINTESVNKDISINDEEQGPSQTPAEVTDNAQSETPVIPNENDEINPAVDTPKQRFNIQEIKGPNLSEESDNNSEMDEDSDNEGKPNADSLLKASSTATTPELQQPGEEENKGVLGEPGSPLTDGSILPESTAAGLVAKDLDLSDDDNSSFGDEDEEEEDEDDDDDDDEQDMLSDTLKGSRNSNQLPNSLPIISKLDDDPAMDIDDAILEKAVSENFKKVPRLDLDAGILDDPEKLKQHEDALNFGSMSPLLPPLDDFNFNMLQIPTFEENSLPEHIIQENAIFTLTNEHDYCLPSATKRTSPLPISNLTPHRSCSHSSGRNTSGRIPPKKKLKVRKPTVKKTSKKRSRSSSSSSSSTTSSSCGSNCSCSSTSSSSSSSSSSSDSDGETHKPSKQKNKTTKSKHERHVEKIKVAYATNAKAKKPKKQVIPKPPKAPKPPKPPPKKRGPKPNPNRIKKEVVPKRKYKKGNNKVRGRPRLNKNTNGLPRLENFIPESDLETEDSGSDEIFHKRQLTEVIGKEIPPFDEIWTMGNEKFLLKVVRGISDLEELRPPPLPAKEKAPKPKKARKHSLSYSVKKSDLQPRLKVRNVPIKPLIVKRQMESKSPDGDKAVFMYGQTPLIGKRPLQTSLETNSTANVITISRGVPNAATAAPASALVLGKRPLPAVGQKPVINDELKAAEIDGLSPVTTPPTPQRKGQGGNAAQPLVNSNQSGSSSGSPVAKKKARGKAKKIVSEEVPDEKLYCICQSPHDTVSQMIGCDDKDCEYQWFHFECVGILIPPKGKWFCSDCRERRRKKYK